MAKKEKGGSIPRPTLDKPKNMPGSMPSPAIGSMFGGKKKMSQGGGSGKTHKPGGDFGPDQHGLHGAVKKGARMASKSAGPAKGKPKIKEKK